MSSQLFLSKGFESHFTDSFLWVLLFVVDLVDVDHVTCCCVFPALGSQPAAFPGSSYQVPIMHCCSCSRSKHHLHIQLLPVRTLNTREERVSTVWTSCNDYIVLMWYINLINIICKICVNNWNTQKQTKIICWQTFWNYETIYSDLFWNRRINL